MRESPRRTLAQKLCEIIGTMHAIEKSGTNKEQGYNFIEQAAIVAHLRKLFHEHGVLLISAMKGKPEIIEGTNAKGNKFKQVLLAMNFVLVNADNSEDRIDFGEWYGEAHDYSDKAVNKATTAAQKYFLIRQFLVSDIDPDVFGDAAHAPERKRPATEPEKQSKVKLADWRDHTVHLPTSKRGLHGKKLGSLSREDLELIRDKWLMSNAPTGFNALKSNARDKMMAAMLRLALDETGLQPASDKLNDLLHESHIPAEELLKAGREHGWFDAETITDIHPEKIAWLINNWTDCLAKIDFVTL